MSFQVRERAKSQGLDPAFVLMFTAIVLAVIASMTLRLTVGGGPAKAHGETAEVEKPEARSQ